MERLLWWAWSRKVLKRSWGDTNLCVHACVHVCRGWEEQRRESSQGTQRLVTWNTMVGLLSVMLEDA